MHVSNVIRYALACPVVPLITMTTKKTNDENDDDKFLRECSYDLSCVMSVHGNDMTLVSYYDITYSELAIPVLYVRTVACVTYVQYITMHVRACLSTRTSLQLNNEKERAYILYTVTVCMDGDGHMH